MSGFAAFDKAVVNGNVIGDGVLEPGSATLSAGGSDRREAAADGKTLQVRVAVQRRASFRALGDWTWLSSGQGASAQASLHLGGVALASFAALATVSYDADSRCSSITLKGDPQDV